MLKEPIRPEDTITDKVIGAAIEVHKHLGPGLLESAYQHCLAYEMSQRGLQFEMEKPLPVRYKHVALDCGYRLDFLVEGVVIVELKAVEAILDIHRAQIITYLRLTNLQLGLLLNFNVPILRSGGIKRVVNQL